MTDPTIVYFRHRKHGSMIGQRNKTVLFMSTNRLSILGLSSIQALTNALLEIFQKTPVSKTLRHLAPLLSSAILNNMFYYEFYRGLAKIRRTNQFSE